MSLSRPAAAAICTTKVPPKVEWISRNSLDSLKISVRYCRSDSAGPDNQLFQAFQYIGRNFFIFTLHFYFLSFTNQNVISYKVVS